MKKIVSEQGEEIEDFSTYCPICGTTNIEKGQISGQEFDETGWYQTVSFSCKAVKCGHKWVNKVMLAEGGTRFHNW